jgi:uncharacterized protein YdeI (BOF family)
VTDAATDDAAVGAPDAIAAAVDDDVFAVEADTNVTTEASIVDAVDDDAIDVADGAIKVNIEVDDANQLIITCMLKYTQTLINLHANLMNLQE